MTHVTDDKVEEKDILARLARQPAMTMPRCSLPSAFIMIDGEFNGPFSFAHDVLEFSAVLFSMSHDGCVRVLDWVDVRINPTRPPHPDTSAWWDTKEDVKLWLRASSLPLSVAAATVAKFFVHAMSTYYITVLASPVCVDKAWLTSLLFRGAQEWDTAHMTSMHGVNGEWMAQLAHLLGTRVPFQCLKTRMNMLMDMFPHMDMDTYKSQLRAVQQLHGVRVSHRSIDDCIAQMVEFAWQTSYLKYRFTRVEWACNYPPSMRDNESLQWGPRTSYDRNILIADALAQRTLLRQQARSKKEVKEEIERSGGGGGDGAGGGDGTETKP